MAILTGVVALPASALLYPSGTSYRLIVRDFRFRKDDGSEADASWAAPLNTNLPDIGSSENYRVRFSIENVGLSDDSVINYGHLEVSEDGGTYKTMGMDAFTSPVVIPPHTLNNVSSLTTTAAMDAGNGVLFVDSNGIWHLAYREWTDGLFSTYRIVFKTSITQGQTWRTHTFDIHSEEILSVTEAPNGDILVLTTSYLFRSTTSGLTWETELSRPIVSGAAIFGFFINASGDYIIAEGYAMKYYVSTDLGITWAAYQNNDFPAALGVADIYYELDDTTGDLTAWYAGTTSNDDPVKLYRWIDTYPYTGFPNASEDDISQLLFTGDSGLTNTFENNAAVFVRSYSGMNLILYSSAWGVEPPAVIVETSTDNFEFKNLDYISQNWDDTGAFDTSPHNIKTIVQGRAGSVLYTDYGALGFSGNTYRFTPGFMGWYDYGNSNVSSVQYSPSVNKWYVVETTTGSVINCYELEWSQVPDGTHTTQQISSGSFTGSNYGYTHHNMIRGDSIAVPAGEKVEYEYAFRLRPTEDVAGKVICLRPSGFGQYDNIACFTIPVGVAYLDVTAAFNVAGDTDGPKCSMRAVAGFKLLVSAWDDGASTWDAGISIWDYFPTQYADAEVVRNGAIALSTATTVLASVNVTKFGAVSLAQPCGFTGLAWVEHAAACTMLVSTNLTLASTNTKLVTTNLLGSSEFTQILSSTEIRVRTVLQSNSIVSTTAKKDVPAAASLHTRSLLGVRSSPDELHIDLVIYEEEPESILAAIAGSIWDAGVSVWDAGLSIWDAELPIEIDAVITQDKPLTIIAISAKLVIIQAPKPDLVIVQQPPLRVYLYELY